jgi:hypothetical protein
MHERTTGMLRAAMQGRFCLGRTERSVCAAESAANGKAESHRRYCARGYPRVFASLAA